MLVFFNDSKKHSVECPNCHGTGKIYDPFYASLFTGLPPWNRRNQRAFPCTRCGGTGKLAGLIL